MVFETTDVIAVLLRKIAASKKMRKPLLDKLEKHIYKKIVTEELDNFPKSIQEKKYYFMKAMLRGMVGNLEKGHISNSVIKRIINTLVVNSFINIKSNEKMQDQFAKKEGVYPPNFIVLSPTQKCNLNCIGCYADSHAKSAATLPFGVVDRIVDEAYNKWGNRFMTISGGEPFMYYDKGKTLIDIFKKYDKMFFLVYTNGTLITKQMAEKLAKLGNVTPAISVEGYEIETDSRRGKGIFSMVLVAFANLRAAGVPFGISVTATKHNFDLLKADKFYDFFFDKQGATYMWQFQFMPIGRAKADAHLMITPEQRVVLYRQWEKMLEKKGYCIADFWNSGVLSNGCIAYAKRGNGYLYINWDGNVMPCVFVPYYVDNVKDLFSEGKSVTDALKSRFFENGRKWQEKYQGGYGCGHQAENWLMPCSIRDHYSNFKNKILTPDVKAENPVAEESLKSKEYEKMMDKFDKQLDMLTRPIWEDEYRADAD